MQEYFPAFFAHFFQCFQAITYKGRTKDQQLLIPSLGNSAKRTAV